MAKKTFKARTGPFVGTCSTSGPPSPQQPVSFLKVHHKLKPLFQHKGQVIKVIDIWRSSRFWLTGGISSRSSSLVVFKRIIFKVNVGGHALIVRIGGDIFIALYGLVFKLQMNKSYMYLSS